MLRLGGPISGITPFPGLLPSSTSIGMLTTNGTTSIVYDQVKRWIGSLTRSLAHLHLLLLYEARSTGGMRWVGWWGSDE